MKKNNPDFENDKISKIFLNIAPPVMLAQLIQALYNVVDSFFIGRYDANGLTALSIIYPVQLIMIAFAVGTGVGVNTGIAKYNGLRRKKKAKEIAGVGTPLAIISWLIFAIILFFLLPVYSNAYTKNSEIANQVISYGRIISIGGIGLFCESTWTKIHQSVGDMKQPMIAQVAGAATNIIFDPILIFGLNMGIKGAAIATILGQIIAATIVLKGGFFKAPHILKFPHYIKEIYRMGFPNILMQAAFTVYILGLNLILERFGDKAITVLGLYYKWQSFFIIPLTALQTCIVPLLSFNYARYNISRCRKIMRESCLWCIILMFIGIICFEFIPAQMFRVFSSDLEVIKIGAKAFRIIAISFIGIVFSLIFPVFFQAVNKPIESSILTIIRTVSFIPFGYIFAKFGLDYFWLTFPVTELITSIVAFAFYISFLKKAKVQSKNLLNK